VTRKGRVPAVERDSGRPSLIIGKRRAGWYIPFVIGKKPRS